jgi:hypothetical protein
MPKNSSTIALKYAGDIVRLVDVSLDGLVDSPEITASLKGQFGKLLPMLEGRDDRDIGLQRGIIFQYLFVLRAIEMTSGATRSKEPGNSGFASTFLIDPAHTVEIVNPYFEALMKFAENPLVGEPPNQRFSHEKFGWWAYNPAGKLLLDATLTNIGPRIRHFEQDKMKFVASRDALRARLKSLAVDGE